MTLACRISCRSATRRRLRDISGSAVWMTGSGGGQADRSALLESQESARRRPSIGFDGLTVWILHACHNTMHISVGWTPKWTVGRDLSSNGGQAANQLTRSALPKWGLTKQAVPVRGRPLTCGPRRGLPLAHKSGMSWEGIDDQDVTLLALHHHTFQNDCRPGP